MENKEPELKEEERQKCEIWTRIMGYFRPLSVFNPGKKSEFRERRYFSEEKALTPAEKDAASGQKNRPLQTSRENGRGKKSVHATAVANRKRKSPPQNGGTAAGCGVFRQGKKSVHATAVANRKQQSTPETAAQRPAAAFSAAFAAPRYSAKFSPAVIFRIDFIFILC